MERKKFTINKRLDVWNNDPNCKGRKNCKDLFGREIKLDHYNLKDQYGWTIDHVKPLAFGGGDEIENLQPLHWKSNLEKGDSPHFCKRL
ncbi:HNH endonuclease signature motif containing protein [Candidatus Hepatoplasma crinochetorum]|jgi:5-methylcytosine-specific restriction endonuclease McrA|uniref:HNH endonuclease n=1 Tax=Candidatus Hepatoplasma crinochetorum Av TaxID=1427984 RepID=W8GN62_9MOLU|nr:HNH endonuclease signature motif containing protein [Candidatus Hepatoplasma crinochetorum]AHK22446.1 HNH endonuclease [Candidatus Hepatoplasma crinochetorum Av]BDV03035.1 MAG: hypothetical protein HCTKY_3290 [Candidatus Hepatoplasma crinochetorum]